MIFESLWPLALLAASVPAVIILYLLKPRGKDHKISSILLWERLFRNQQSKTFWERFVHNILMYLQILILILLVLSLMSPYLQGQGRNRGNVILVLDTSGSMQHDAGKGRSRLEEAAAQAKDLIAASEDTSFSVVSADCTGAELLAAGVKDKDRLYRILDQLQCCDGEGGLQEAEGLVEALCRADGDGETSPAEVLLFTDGIGAEEAEGLVQRFGAQVLTFGEEVSNVANHFLSWADAEEGTDADADQENNRFLICASSLTNYSDTEASMEIGLYEGNRLLEIRQVTLGAGETSLCFFDAFSWQGEPLKSQISSISFAGSGQEDSLPQDNTAYALPGQSSQIKAVLAGEGNTFIEKAYQAATGNSLARVTDLQLLPEAAEWVHIYDAGTEADPDDKAGRLVFRDNTHAVDTVKGVLLTVSGCDLTAGLASFSIGVNETNVYEVPEWGTGFLWAGDQCAGYYGDQDGIRKVVVGFDIRESDFPLKAEFPVFISNALRFLSETSLLAENVYKAGDSVIFHPQPDLDTGALSVQTRKAGLYQAEAGDRSEAYVVRFATDSQSDGRIMATGGDFGASAGNGLVKRHLRNGLLAAALIMLAAEWFLYVRQMGRGNRFYLAVRIMTAVMLLLAMTGMGITRRSNLNTTIFLVDISNSNRENLAAMEEYLNQALGEMPGKNQYGIVTFGKNSMVEQFLTKEDHFSGIMSLPDKTATNFEDAVSRALAMLPGEGAGRLVVLTDGRQTKGDLTNTAAGLTSTQTDLLAFVYGTEQGQDAYVENVELPGYLYQGDAYSMTVTVESNYDTDAQIQIWMGSIQIQSYEVHLHSGTNQFRFRQQVMGENIESFEVRVAAPGDTCRENDSYHAYSVVDSAPRILLVSGMGEDSGQFQEVLRSANCSYSTVSALNAPSTLDQMLEFRSIILNNVYLSDLPSGFLENIETYVKDYGCGLVSCGGEDSFALGGYRESVLETILPVDMELRGVDEIPVTAMIMVIDHSGSMIMDSGSGATNLDLAITAAKTAVDQLRSTDYVGVVSFDDTFSWVVEPVQASDKETIKEKIETIAEGGGTTIQPALNAALDGVLKCEAGIRHVILLTDGQGESRSYSNITASYQSASVTLSTVAVGSGSDTKLLERLAKDCGGRYYYSDTAADIPKIFAQEVFLSGDTYLQNGVFALAVNGSSEITRGLFEGGWPMIYGYVSATPKNISQVLIASEKDDPVLTVMQYGLGHTVAWNTDVTNRWTAEYAGQEDYVQLWKRIIDYSAGHGSIGEDSLEVITAGGYTDVLYHALDYGQDTRVEAVYTDPEGNTYTEPLQAVAPGRFEARLDTDVTGLYSLSIRRLEGESISNAVTTAVAVQYSDEYKFDVSTAPFLSFVERFGRILEPGESFWQQRKSEARQRLELTKWLILMAIVWFVLDIALRRLCFLPQDTRLYRRVRSTLKERIKGGRLVLPGRTREKKIPEAEGQDGMGSTAGDHAQMISDTDNSGKAQKKAAGGKEKRSAAKQTAQALDTSSLLKKRDQRNQL
ncbi:MAG: VWA domain-containing protein [Acetatifactor sp.]|nr:VWA domain-containing protein [Acetatifactor sp.]